MRLLDSLITGPLYMQKYGSPTAISKFLSLLPLLSLTTRPNDLRAFYFT
jgi:hypothetical protein